MEVSEFGIIGWGVLLGFGFSFGIRLQDYAQMLSGRLGAWIGNKLADRKFKKKAG